MIPHLAQLLSASGAVVLAISAALGAGGFCGKMWSEFGGLRPAERLAMRFLGGCGLIGLLTFLIGQFYFSTPLIVAVFAGSAALNFRFPWRFDWRFSARADGAIWLLFGSCTLLVCVVSGFDRPVGDLGADEIAYHLLGPVTWLREQKIAPVAHESLTAFPATVEVLFAMVRGISNDRAPGVLGVVFFGALLLQVRGLAQKMGATERGANLAVALLATMPAVTATVDRCFVDAPFAAFSLAAARLAFDASRRRHIVLAGVFAGFAAGTKYLGLPLIVVTAGVLFFQRNNPAKNRACDAVAFLASAALAGCAWYFRNWIVLGNPIYPPPPALWNLLPTAAFPLDASLKMQAYVAERGQGLGRGVGDFFLLPFRLTYQTALFHGGGGIGLGPLAFAPIGMALAWWQRVARAFVVWSVLLALAWFFTDQEMRFLDAALAVGCVFAGLGCDAMFRRNAAASRALAAAALAISLLHGALITVQSRAERLLSVLSPSRASARWRANVPYREAFDFLNTRGEVEKVLVCNPGTPTYFLRKNYVMPRGRWGERSMAGVDSVAESVRILPGLGVSHVLDVNSFGGGFAWPESGAGKLVHASGNVRIYEVSGTSDAR